MLHNYLKIAYRSIIRNKAFSVINILGLAVGIASSLLLILWVQDEWQKGKHYDQLGDLYRIMENEIADGRIVTDYDTPGILAKELKVQLPEVAYAASISGHEDHIFSVGDKVTRQPGYYVGSDWFNIYRIPLLAGTRESALTEPGSVAISRKLAAIYFHSPDAALGKMIRMDDKKDLRITAVFEDLPSNALEHYEFLRNWEDYLKMIPWFTAWEAGGPGTRLRLQPNADPAKVNAKLKSFLKGRSKDINATFNIELFLQPESEVYLYSNFSNGQRNGGRISYVRIFIIVAIFLLVIAAINFMNLSTARAMKRAKEVGVRKVVGARRLSLIWQFMHEAILMTILAGIIAILLVWACLPLFNIVSDKHLALPFTNGIFWLLLLVILIATAALSGSYPAIFLSSMQPLRVLKGWLKAAPEAQLFRRVLVVFQFVLSILMIIGTIVVYQQLKYIQSRNLGFNKENLIIIPGEGNLRKHFDTFKKELLQQPGIANISYMQSNPLENGNTTDGVKWRGMDPNLAIQFSNATIGYDFVRTMKLTLLSGREFSPDFGTDTAAYLINEETAKRLGYADPIGQPLTFGQRPGTIIGLLKNYNFNSLHEPIRPIILRLAGGWGAESVLVRVQPGQTKQALASIETICKQMNPMFPFTYSFLDKDYEAVYKSEAIVGRLVSLFTGLSVFIACLGLFGLAAFTAEQRTKEIGIRKVLGASVVGIVTLLSRDFLKLVLVAIIIASPLAWYAMAKWLENFSYRVSISWMVFVLAGIAALTIAALTISFQSVKAALMNPVNSLKGD
ncbi:FtsX-like permease family protein [Chitinophaga dinghuensis]|uniref:FtsX-like permease family protein n=1 Tax=Chitinophaga dinghuensis TaxID=1539050 RepID=A0A327VKF1_9BACT|nr:ABC transporter permease [Chitinophaga dinghuensis]RAJ74972.1 FtsX-like permease family protein [Chitinophaga dinghuensis]